MSVSAFPDMIEMALRPFAPPPAQHHSVGVIHYEDGWHIYWRGKVDDETFPDRTAAIDELSKRDRAERFCEVQS